MSWVSETMTPKRKTQKPVAKRAGPSEVASGVFVGGWNDSVKFEGARFCVLDEAPDELEGAAHYPIYDPTKGEAIPENLDRLARAMEKAHDGGKPVLVFCGHGIRRGPLGAAWYLHRAEGIPLPEAFDRVAEVRPRIERPREWIESPENLEKA
jgi:protein-tyrosine phosphatase